MRRLRRPAVALPTLTHDGPGAREHLRQVGDASLRDRFPPHWLHPDVRGALRAMQGWVCAYCLKELADGDEVEHFRPKSVYWWLAYDFSNYFLACHRCNRGSVKGTRFPLAEEAERTTWAARDRLDDEPRLVADPVCDPVEDWFTVDVLEGSCPVEVRPSVDRASRAFSVAQRSIEFFQLNQDVDLVQERSRAYVSAFKLYEAGGVAALRRRASRYAPQGMTWRVFIESMVNDVAPPTPDEELLWFLDDVDAKLRVHDALYARGRTTDAIERAREELGWLLAVIARDPPALDSARIERWLAERELLAWVSEFRARLR